MTAPPFILGTTSLTEFSAYWTEHPSIFVAPASEPDPAKRALLVLKWFLSTLKQQYSSRSDKFGSEKKPLNPFLGEVFQGRWEDEAGTTHLVSEQVRYVCPNLPAMLDSNFRQSHHPPVTAYCIWNEKHGIKVIIFLKSHMYIILRIVQLQGYNAQKASFSRTINVKQIGHAILEIDSFHETYLITLPSLHIENLLYGNPFVELNKTSYITSSSGYVARIDYSGKGWLSGKKNSFTASLYPAGKEKEPLHTIEGQWTDTFIIRDGTKKSGGEIEAYNARTSKITPLIVAPLDQQEIYESNRAWQHVAAAISKGDMDTVGIEKAKIENAQRELRRKEQSEGREWERRFFKKVPRCPNFEKLSKSVGERIESDKTGGVWRVDEKKVREAKASN